MQITLDLDLNEDGTVETWLSSPSIAIGVPIGGSDLSIFTVLTAIHLLVRSEVVVQSVEEVLSTEK